jgi:hypothetical protein
MWLMNGVTVSSALGVGNVTTDWAIKASTPIEENFAACSFAARGPRAAMPPRRRAG